MGGARNADIFLCDGVCREGHAPLFDTPNGRKTMYHVYADALRLYVAPCFVPAQGSLNAEASPGPTRWCTTLDLASWCRAGLCGAKGARFSIQASVGVVLMV